MSREPKDEDGSTDQSDRAYKVGYAKPPVETRFKPGNNANPKGRPRKRGKSASELLGVILDEMVVVTSVGKKVRMTKREVYLRTHVQQAMKGDRRHIAALLQYDERRAANSGDETVISDELDRQVVDLFLRDRENGLGVEGDPSEISRKNKA